MKTKYLALLAAALLPLTASAQLLEGVGYGYITRQADFNTYDLYTLSKFNANLGTARSAAMGGAFTSLGADLSSMNINPAGLGMYQTSEFGITASLLFNNVKGTMEGERTTKDSRTSFGLNNIGAAFNVYQGSGALTSFTFGVNYNKLADHNYRSSLSLSPMEGISINYMFAPQVGEFVLREGAAALSGNPWNNNIDHGGAYFDEWGAILAYKVGLVQLDGSTGKYSPNLSPSALGAQYMTTLSKGSTREYTFSGGWNFRNKVYFGLSMGYIDIYKTREVTFDEDYTGNGDGFAWMSYYQRHKTVGEGVNFKAGIVVRPVQELRIGLAVHSPTIMTLKTSYYADMESNLAGQSYVSHASTGDHSYTEKFYSPTRLLAGVSYTIGGRALVAFDYERAWYNGMRLRGESNLYKQSVKDEYKEDIKASFTGSNTFRFGTEIRVTDELAVRGGLVYDMEGLADDIDSGRRAVDFPMEKHSLTGSLGLGLRLSARTSLDFTYMFCNTAYTNYNVYLYYPADDTPGPITLTGVEMKRNRHSAMLSLNCRF